MKSIFKTLIVISIICQVGCKEKQSKQIHDAYNETLGKIAVHDAIKDMEQMTHILEQRHYNPYLHQSQETHDQFKQNVIGQWIDHDSIMLSQFCLDMMSVLSLIEDGHTGLQWFTTDVLPNRDSLAFFPVTTKYIHNSSLTHMESDKSIETINGYAAIDLYEDALSLLSGEKQYKINLNNSLFFAVYLHLRGIFPPYEISYSDGLSSVINANQTINFMSLYMRLKGTLTPHSFEYIEGIPVITYNSAEDHDGFELLLSQAFSEIKESEIKTLIIDIRKNSGGNSSVNDVLLNYITSTPYRQSSKRLWKISEVSISELESRNIKEYYGHDYIKQYQSPTDSTILDFLGGEELITPQWKKDKYDGEVYLLIGPGTYSSANMLADAFKTYNIGTLVGQPTGERVNDFGEQKIYILPNSQLPISYTIAYDIGADGDPNHLSTVEPDIEVDQDALQYTLGLIKK